MGRMAIMMVVCCLRRDGRVVDLKEEEEEVTSEIRLGRFGSSGAVQKPRLRRRRERLSSRAGLPPVFQLQRIVHIYYLPL